MPLKGAMKEGVGGSKRAGFCTLLRERWRKGWRQALILLSLGLAGGVVYNEFSGLGMPWREDWSVESVTRRYLDGLEAISLEQAWEGYKQGKVQFLDARDPGSFSLGHLPGAINLPPEEAPGLVNEIKGLVEAGMIPVAYCDGADCPLSAQLAQVLRSQGVEGVRVLINGWSLWLQAGFPVEGGDR